MPAPDRLIRLARAGCWIAVAISYVAALLPQREAPHLGASDKLDHMAAFLAISVLGRIGYPRPAWAMLLVAISAFGGLIELSQMLPAIGRDAEWGDWIADTVAAIAGLLVAWPALASLRAVERNGR